MPKILLPKSEPITSRPVVLGAAVLFVVMVVALAITQTYFTIKRVAAQGIAEEVQGIAADTKSGVDFANTLQDDVFPQFDPEAGQSSEVLRQRSVMELRDELGAVVEEMGERLNMNKYQQLPVAEEAETYGEEYE